jgi:hypothetical protein
MFGIIVKFLCVLEIFLLILKRFGIKRKKNIVVGANSKYLSHFSTSQKVAKYPPSIVETEQSEQKRSVILSAFMKMKTDSNNTNKLSKKK